MVIHTPPSGSLVKEVLVAIGTFAVMKILTKKKPKDKKST